MNKKNRSIFSNLRNYVIILTSLIFTSILSVIAVLITNAKILKYSSGIVETLIKPDKGRIIFIMYISACIAALSLVLLALFFVKAYRKIFYPIKQLYRGMAEIGIAGPDIDLQGVENKQMIPMYNEVKEIFDKLNSLVHLIENLNKNLPFKDILNYIYNSFSSYIPYTHIGVALIDYDSMTLRASYGVASKKHKNLPKRLLGYSAYIEETSLGNIINTGKERVINDLEEYVKGKPLKEYNKILIEAGIRSSMTFPLRNNDQPVGIIFFSSDTKNVYKQEHVEFLRILANSITLGLEKSILFDDMIVSSVQSLAQLAEQRDPETGEHLHRMSKYSRILAELLSQNKKYADIIDVEYVNNIERFSQLHDIGKVGIRDDILLKQGRLSLEEFAVMKTHTIYGSWVLKNADESLNKRGRSIFIMGVDIAEGHHEKWDGTGYPYGKSGGDIPLSARIVAAADVFDALTSKRPYKSAFTFDESCKIIIEESGKHFDPDVAGMFITYNDKIRSVYEEFKEIEQFKNISEGNISVPCR